MSTEALKDIQAARDRVAARLQANPDFIALLKLDQLLAQLGATSQPAPVLAPVASPTSNQGAVSMLPTRKMSQREAALTSILEAGRPLSTEELLPLVEAKGVQMTGDKRTNLASALSREERVHSIPWGGSGRKWWFKDREPPQHGDALSTKAAVPTPNGAH